MSVLEKWSFRISIIVRTLSSVTWPPLSLRVADLKAARKLCIVWSCAQSCTVSWSPLLIVLRWLERYQLMHSWSFRATLSIAHQLFHLVRLSKGILLPARSANCFIRPGLLRIYTTILWSFPRTLKARNFVSYSLFSLSDNSLNPCTSISSYD